MTPSSAPEQARPADVLPCGRALEAVTAHAHAGELDSHEQQCPFCLAATASTERLRQASATLTAATAVQIPAISVVPAVMLKVLSELRPGRFLALPSSGRTLFVSETAYCTAVTAQLEDISDVVIRRCTVHEVPAPAAAPGVVAGAAQKTSVVVTMTASIVYGADAGALAQLIRQRVGQASQLLFGLPAAQVDIGFTDLLTGGTRA